MSRQPLRTAFGLSLSKNYLPSRLRWGWNFVHSSNRNRNEFLSEKEEKRELGLILLIILGIKIHTDTFNHKLLDRMKRENFAVRNSSPCCQQYTSFPQTSCKVLSTYILYSGTTFLDVCIIQHSTDLITCFFAFRSS